MTAKFNKMEAIKKTLNPVMETMKIDPRIDSPQIKVVYPAPAMILKDLPEEDAATPPTAPVQATAPAQQEAPAAQTAGTSASASTSPVQSWQDTIKQNPMLFAIIGLLALGIGFILGKNRG